MEMMANVYGYGGNILIGPQIILFRQTMASCPYCHILLSATGKLENCPKQMIGWQNDFIINDMSKEQDNP